MVRTTRSTARRGRSSYSSGCMNLPADDARMIFSALSTFEVERRSSLPDLYYVVERGGGTTARGLVVTHEEDGGLILNVEPWESNRQETIAWDDIARITIEVAPD
jgi:hypothetical protein